jgi:hypothetical protein
MHAKYFLHQKGYFYVNVVAQDSDPVTKNLDLDPTKKDPDSTGSGYATLIVTYTNTDSYSSLKLIIKGQNRKISHDG